MFVGGLDGVDQVARHALGQVVAAVEERHLLGVAGEVDRRLAGRVRAADDDHVLVAARHALAARAAVVDAAAGQLLDPRRVQPAVVDAGRDDHRRGAQLVAAGQPDDLGRAALVDLGHLLDGQQLGAEALRLGGRAAGQVAAARGRPGSRGSSRSASSGRPGRPAPRARSAPSAGPRTRRRPPPPARPGRRRRSPGRRTRSSARRRHAGALGQLGGSSAPAATPPSGNSTSGSAAVAVGRGQQPPGLVVALDVEPAVRHLVSGQEVAGVVRLARPAVADDLDPVGRRPARRPARRRAGRRRPGRAAPRADPRASAGSGRARRG